LSKSIGISRSQETNFRIGGTQGAQHGRLGEKPDAIFAPPVPSMHSGSYLSEE
ncbi:hypothetical protein BaRGS_00008387, partial [Batillaria attramentaria]